ncbi:DNA polymerase, beta domain protein region [Francisella sp. W12-1067]|nr:DNA polymerase, beta domain protein region [Francisella sp. W12-1067]
MLIREKDKNTLVNIAKKTINTPCEIIAYGSRVDGSAHDTSDLDLVIRSKKGFVLTFNELIDFKEKIQNSNIPILVQVFDWNRIPENFKSGILGCYEILCEVRKK